MKSCYRCALPTIDVTDDAWEAILELYHRAQKVAASEPNHYVFPACENGHIDPTVPQKSWRSAWRSLRKAAGLAHLRFHDLRHHAITELAESEDSEQKIMSLAGHVSDAGALLAHSSGSKTASRSRPVPKRQRVWYVTKHVTDGVDASTPELLTREKSGRGERI